VGADGDTVTTTDTVLIGPGSGRGNRIIPVAFYHQGRALKDTDVVALTLFRVYRE
jgi:hypothetical protein